MDPIIDYLRKQLTEQRTNLIDTVSSGSSADYPEYRYQVGIIEGLGVALQELKLAENRMYNDNEESEDK